MKRQVVNPGVFYLYPGFVEQVRVLAGKALENMPADAPPPPVIVGPEGSYVNQLVNAAREQLQAGRRQVAVPALSARRNGY